MRGINVSFGVEEWRAKKERAERSPRLSFFFRTPAAGDQKALAFLASLLDLTLFHSSLNSHPPSHTRSAERKQFALEIPAGVTAAAGAMLASPLAASAEVTPSLKNLINSVVAGGVVLVAIVVAVTAVSGFDPITRK